MTFYRVNVGLMKCLRSKWVLSCHQISFIVFYLVQPGGCCAMYPKVERDFFLLQSFGLGAFFMKRTKIRVVLRVSNGNMGDKLLGWTVCNNNFLVFARKKGKLKGTTLRRGASLIFPRVVNRSIGGVIWRSDIYLGTIFQRGSTLIFKKAVNRPSLITTSKKWYECAAKNSPPLKLGF